ncbi:2Fe-2S iron-sulfur cluster-binding protein [Photobacterium sp. 53610]|uniref:2Fe-2S iron-sulfur cluster-binding protein n=1 Tax=Photobacterium sp. 53610 TaxID=3102789 RepID=UPI002ED8A835
MPEIKIKISDIEIFSDIEDNLINNIPSDYITKGCLNGVCRVCRCKLVAGQVMENGKMVNTPNMFLPCVSKALTDITIEPYVSNYSIGTIRQIEYLDKSIIEIQIKIKKQFFTSKSIVNIFSHDLKVTRSYSLVTMYKDGFDLLRIHVKLKEDGVFSNWFLTLNPGDEVRYQIVNIPVPRYEEMSRSINVISGGSGMGAALSRALELSEKHALEGINVIAINRSSLSFYHENCIREFTSRVDCSVHVQNVRFPDWDANDIDRFISKEFFTVSVGSTAVTEKVSILDNKEIEYFG